MIESNLNPIKVAYLGPSGTYTHQAAIQGFPNDTHVPTTTIPDCFTNLRNGLVDVAVVPIENSTNGSVVFTLDQLRKLCFNNTESQSNLHVVDEIFVSINHCLLTIGAKDLSQIQRVYSHPQVWGQCDKWYDTYLKGIEKIDTSSTSKAVELVKNDPTSAAIASRAAGIVHGVPVVVPDISDNDDNTTRFLVLSRSPLEAPSSDELPSSYGTFLSFVIEHHQPGALCKALNIFSHENINLTSIVSRPSGREQWTYVFFVEFEGHQQDANVQRLVKALDQYCSELRVIGSFHRKGGKAPN